jgi:hypothetical protein
VALVAVVAGAVAWWALAPLDSATTQRGGAEPEPEPQAEPPGPAWFRNVTPGSGIDFTAHNGKEAGQYAILETLGSGVALIDYDGDGLLDVFLAGGGYFAGPDTEQIKGHPCKLYRNLGNVKFEDVTAKVGLDKVDWWYTHGAAVADYDRDGWPDLLVTGYGRLKLFHNEPDGAGGRKFVEVTEKLGLVDDSWSTSAGWADLDGDGWPDLYVCHYCDWSFANNPVCPALTPKGTRDICPPQRFKPLSHVLFHNDRGAGFSRWSALGPAAKGHGLGVVLADINGDGRPDIYVANDTSYNLLFMNRGFGRFDEIAHAAGVATDETGRPNGSMGVDVGDYDGSGRASLWVTNFFGEHHALYQNRGKESFLHQSQAAGIGAIGQHYVGFGTGFLDGDNDGWEDIVIANGNVFNLPDEAEKQRPVLLQNVERNGRRYFREAGTRGEPFFRAPALGRGLAIGDLNNDGWPDLVFVHTNAPVVVLRNVVAEHAPAHWVGVKLAGRDKRDVVGSTVVAEAGTRKLTRFAKGGGSYMSACDQRILFGLGPADRVTRVTVKWSWGKEQTWEGLAPGQYWELLEGEKDARPLGTGAPPKR